MNPDDMKSATVKELFEKFSSRESGLSALEAKERLQQYGYNEIVQKKINPIIKFLGYSGGRFLSDIKFSKL